MKAVPGREELTARELRLGKALFRSDSPVLLPYLSHRREVLEAKLSGLRKAAAPDRSLIAETEEDLRILASFPVDSHWKGTDDDDSSEHL